MTIYPPSEDRIWMGSRNLTLGYAAHTRNSSLLLRGWMFFPTCQFLCTDLLDGFFLTFPAPLFLTKLATIYTGTLRCLPLFLPHDHTRHYNAHVCTPLHAPVSLGLWLSSALVVTYYCFPPFLASLSHFFFFLVLCFSSILGDYTRVWFCLCPSF